MTDLQVKYQQTQNEARKIALQEAELEERKRSNLANEAIKIEGNRLQQMSDISKFGNWYADQEAATKDRGYSIARWIKDAGDMVSSWSPFSIKL